jgi:hypothetical protein
MSTAAQRMHEHVWPEIEAMMSNDAHFRLVLQARQLTKKFNGPTAKLLQDGYLTLQMVAIRRLCDKRSDVYSLRRALMEASLFAVFEKNLREIKKLKHRIFEENRNASHLRENEAESLQNVPSAQPALLRGIQLIEQVLNCLRCDRHRHSVHTNTVLVKNDRDEGCSDPDKSSSFSARVAPSVAVKCPLFLLENELRLQMIFTGEKTFSPSRPKAVSPSSFFSENSEVLRA